MMGMGGGPPPDIGAPAPAGGGTVMPPPPGDLGTPTGVLDTGPPGGGPGPAGGPGVAPEISYERMQGMPSLTSSVEELTDEEIERRVEAGSQIIADIEFRKRMRRTASEQRKSRPYETEDIMALTLEKNAKVTIDLVPPKIRRQVLNAV